MFSGGIERYQSNEMGWSDSFVRDIVEQLNFKVDKKI